MSNKDGFVGKQYGDFPRDYRDGGVFDSRDDFDRRKEQTAKFDPRWTRNPQWLEMPDIPEGEQKFIGLYGITDTDDATNQLEMRFIGAYDVDWGDGITQSFSSGAYAGHTYSYSSISSDTIIDDMGGMKQVLVTVTPQSGQNLTLVDLSEAPPNWIATHPYNWLDISIRAPKCTSIQVCGSSQFQGLLERCRIFELSPSIGSLQLLFYGAENLQYVEMPSHPLPSLLYVNSMFQYCEKMRVAPYFDTSNATNFSQMFSYCRNLNYCPDYDTSSGTNFASMFYQNANLRYVPRFDLSSATTTGLAAMFYYCSSIKEFPDDVASTITSNVTSTSQMFINCNELERVALFDTSGVTTFNSMFNSCYRLSNVPAFDTSSATILQGMFSNCYNLRNPPYFDTSIATACSSMFSNCMSLTTIPAYDFSSNLNFSSMFTGCASLRGITYAMDTSSGTNFASMFANCTAIVQLPDFDVSSVTSNTGIDSNSTSGRMTYRCYNLVKATFAGATRAINISQCKFGQEELVDIFNALGTAAGTQVINITSCVGASTLSAAERAIATGKGWTITG